MKPTKTRSRRAGFTVSLHGQLVSAVGGRPRELVLRLLFYSIEFYFVYREGRDGKKEKGKGKSQNSACEELFAGTS